MSDTESAPPPPEHPPTGGKSISLATATTTTTNTNTTTERPRYKSWRKKFRKMRHEFEGKLEENKSLWKEEKKLEGIAKRLQEELDGIMELLLELNQNPALPPHLRFNVSLPTHSTAVGKIPSVVPRDISTTAANQLLADYESAVRRNQIPNLDLHVIRDQIDRALSAQDVVKLEDLESSVNHPDTMSKSLPIDLNEEYPQSYLHADHEREYLLKLDVKLQDPLSVANDRAKAAELEQKHWADLTPRELERQLELENPQSQHNWLKKHTKLTGSGDVDDTESLASHDTKPARGGGGKRNLAKQVGDRAVGRAREGFSPGAASHADEDDLSFIDDHPQTGGKKRQRADPDSTYRIKGGNSKPKAKRKRASEDAGSAKKPKLENVGE